MSNRNRERDRARRTGRWVVCPPARVDRAGPGEPDWVADAVRASLRDLVPGGDRSSRSDVEAFVRAGHRALRRRQAWATALLLPVIVLVAAAGFLLGSAL